MTIHPGGTGATGGDTGSAPCCWVCVSPIAKADYDRAVCWADPDRRTVAAHIDCLLRLGEFELGIGHLRRWTRGGR